MTDMEHIQFNKEIEFKNSMIISSFKDYSDV